MKNILIILILVSVFQIAAGQDIIQTKDNKKLNVRIIEQTDKLVKYKMSDYEDGPIISLKAREITKIEYKNGFVDIMGFQNPRKNKPLGINAGVAQWISESGNMFTSNIDYFIKPQIDLEVNIWTDGRSQINFSGGSRFHLNSKYSVKRLTPFTGILIGAQSKEGFVQIPAGINYISKPGINASISINEMFIFNGWYATIIEFRAGWRFKLPLL